jgi:hypothetical protein
MSVVFYNGKLVVQQKKKVLQMSDLMGSNTLVKSNYNINEFKQFVENYMYIPDDEFEFMNSSIEEPRERFDDEKQYSDLFRRKSNIQIQEQNNRTYINRRKPTLIEFNDEITKRQIEELVHNEVGKFVKETFKNELTQTNIESIEQHKYARLSKGSYMTYRGENVDEMLKEFKPTENFVVDTELTNENATVFHDVKTGETVKAYRGTDPGSLNLNEIEKSKLPNFEDIKTDGAILIGREAKTARFLEAEKTFQKTVNKYGKESINITGHSLGSSQSLYIGEKFDIPSYNFNGAVSVNQVLEDANNKYLLNKSEQILYRTHLYPVSVGALLTSKTQIEK